MKLARYCLQYSIELLKLNFYFIIVVQLVKFLLNSENNNTILNYEKEFFENANLTNTEPVTNVLKTNLNNIFLALTSWYSYDINQLEATKTEVINVINRNDPNFEETKPFIRIKSFINFNEMLQFNNLKNFLKIALVTNLNFTTMLINIILISYLITQRRKLFTNNRIGKSFLKIQLVLNIVLFVIVFMLNLFYMFIVNKYFKKIRFFRI